MAKRIPSGSSRHPQDSSRVSPKKHNGSMASLKKKGHSLIEARLPTLHSKKSGFFKGKIVVLATGSKKDPLTQKTDHLFDKINKSA